jgi:hypothetical protein
MMPSMHPAAAPLFRGYPRSCPHPVITALILGLATQIVAWLAALIVEVVVLAVAGVLALIGKQQAQRAGPLMPEKSAASVKADINTIKEGMHR